MAVVGPTIESMLTEENGEIVGATSVYHVTDVTGSPILETALDTSGVPQPGDSLNASHTDVKVKSRQAQIVGIPSSGNYTVRVDVTYELDRPEAEVTFSLRGGASVNQIETEKDRAGNPIELTYDGKTVRATVNVTSVEGTFQVELVEKTNDPDGLIAQYVNHTNSAAFRGKPRGTWLCTHAEYEPRDLSNTQDREYRFSYEFSYREEEWKYTVAYKGEDGYIPADVVEGQGIKTITWHPERDFAAKFGA